MTWDAMISFLSGALTVAYLVAAVYFLRFWQRTADRLFFSFGVAFLLLALNQVVVFVLGAGDERTNYAYILRVLGFILILVAIIDKNVFVRNKRPVREAGDR